MITEILKLREKMKAHGFDAYMIPTTDFHQSEYVHDHFKCREYLSGFTGSAGTLLVTENDALLWTDGRYFLQAQTQLEGSGISLMKMGQPDVPTINEYLDDFLNENQTLAFDGRLVPACEFSETKFNLNVSHDLVGEIWYNRPEITPSEIYSLGLDVTGESAKSKLTRLRDVISEKGADYHIITVLDEIAWLFNLRGRDVKHTPVFFAYALITSEDAYLYVMDKSLSSKDAQLRPYEDFLKDLGTLPPGKLLLDKKSCSHKVLASLSDNVEVISEDNPVAMMKSIKNETEIAATKSAHLKDGAAMVNFIYWLKKNIGKMEITELSAADKLAQYRAAEKGFYDLSFETISGYGSNGAIIHYAATEETNKTLEPHGLYLLDSGGQYSDGTTDITRTIALGPLTEEMKEHYTAVLKGHIALSMAEFEPGTKGCQLDEIARRPLHEYGLDYNHGTGHGVGHLLGCHEGPQSISPRNKTYDILPGMINSDEPGVYVEGSHGIRLENEILCVDLGDGDYGFEPITFCPFERDAILPEMMTDEELSWLNNYHRQVYEKIGPLVDKETEIWLNDVTSKIQ